MRTGIVRLAWTLATAALMPLATNAAGLALPTELHFCAANCMTLQLEGRNTYRRVGPLSPWEPPGFTSVWTVEAFDARIFVLHRRDSPVPAIPQWRNGLDIVYRGEIAPGGNRLLFQSTNGQPAAAALQMTWGEELIATPGSNAERDQRQAEGPKRIVGAARVSASPPTPTVPPAPIPRSTTQSSSTRPPADPVVLGRDRAEFQREWRDFFVQRALEPCFHFRSQADQDRFRKFESYVSDYVRDMLARATDEGTYKAAIMLGEYLKEAEKHGDPVCINRMPPEAESAPAPRTSVISPDATADRFDRAQLQAMIDRMFVGWSEHWSMDQYAYGSARVDDIKCSANSCIHRGHFSFTRMGAKHTIEFVAETATLSDAKYQLTNLCYDDPTTGTQDCL